MMMKKTFKIWDRAKFTIAFSFSKSPHYINASKKMKYRSNCYIYFSNFLFLSLFCSIKFRIRLDIMRKLNEKKREKTI